MPFPPKRDLAQHVAVVTGASSGFGLGLSRRLAGRGCRVLMADVNPAGEGIAKELNEQYGKGTAVFLKTDVSKPEDVERMFQVAMKEWNRVDIVANNAGVGERNDFYTDESRSGWQTQLSINLAPVILGTQIGIQLAHQQKRDMAILSTASLAGLYPQSGSPIYATVKGAIVHMVRGMKHLADPKNEYKIRVNAICPSFSPTGMQTRVDLPLVPSEMVVDAMMHAIEDTSIAGEAIRITPENGVEVQYFSSRGNKKRLESDLPTRVAGSAEKRPENAMTVGAGVRGKL